jgi:predicted Zn finger-like uncharacterized protein
MIVSCGSCQSKFRIDPAKIPAQGARIRCPKCKGVIAVAPPGERPAAEPPRPAAAPEERPAEASPRRGHAATGSGDSREHPRGDLGQHAGAAANPATGPDGRPAPLVVVAHGNQAFCESLTGFLRRSGFAVETVSDGQAALGLVRERLPRLVLVDVALPGGIVGYALCEKIKQDPAMKDVRVVLVGAIYDRTRYRRPPQSLYGSDGYIEKHEIAEKLVPMLRDLLSGRPAAPGGRSADASTRPRPADSAAAESPGRAAAPVERSAPESPRRADVAPAPEDPAAEQARRLARIIVSDIVLYNPEAVKRGIAEGNLPDLLKDELKEGRELLKARVGAAAQASDYVLEALHDYMRRMSARNGQTAGQR